MGRLGGLRAPSEPPEEVNLGSSPNCGLALPTVNGVGWGETPSVPSQPPSPEARSLFPGGGGGQDGRGVARSPDTRGCLAGLSRRGLAPLPTRAPVGPQSSGGQQGQHLSCTQRGSEWTACGWEREALSTGRGGRDDADKRGPSAATMRNETPAGTTAAPRCSPGRALSPLLGPENRPRRGGAKGLVQGQR